MPEISATDEPPSESGSKKFNQMTDISSGDSKPEPEVQSESFDSSKMRKTKPGIKRLCIVFSVLFSFVLGVFFFLHFFFTLFQ